MMLLPTFCSLATELVETVAGQLQPADLQALRLTCRQIEEKTFRFFCARSFKYLRTDLSRRSLTRIDALSKHTQFQSSVQGLAVELGNGIGRDIAWQRHPWGPLPSPLHVEEIRRLRDNLAHHLVNCRSFFIVCQYPEGRPDLTRMTLSDAVAIVFAIIDDARLPLKCFHLNYSSHRSRSLSMDMRRLSPLVLRQPGFSSAWGHLEHFLLDQHLTLESFPLLLDLVLNAPSLTSLFLNLSCQDLSAGLIHELASSGSFPRLERLGLSRTSVQVNDLQTLLHRLAGSLRVLRFHHVSIISDDGWDSVFGELKTSHHALETISLSHLRVASSACGLVTFPAIVNKPLKDSPLVRNCKLIYPDGEHGLSPVGIEYSGPSFPRLSEVLQSANVQDGLNL